MHTPTSNHIMQTLPSPYPISALPDNAQGLLSSQVAPQPAQQLYHFAPPTPGYGQPGYMPPGFQPSAPTLVMTNQGPKYLVDLPHMMYPPTGPLTPSPPSMMGGLGAFPMPGATPLPQGMSPLFDPALFTSGNVMGSPGSFSPSGFSPSFFMFVELQ